MIARRLTSPSWSMPFSMLWEGPGTAKSEGPARCVPREGKTARRPLRASRNGIPLGSCRRDMTQRQEGAGKWFDPGEMWFDPGGKGLHPGTLPPKCNRRGCAGGAHNQGEGVKWPGGGRGGVPHVRLHTPRQTPFPTPR